MNEEQIKTSSAGGYGRVFLITLLFALLLQAFGFIYMQARAVNDLLRADFKIVLALKGGVSAARVNEIGTALAAGPDVAGLRFVSSEDGFEIIKEQNPKLAENFIFLGRKPMTEYFELTVSDVALADVDAWIKENIEAQIPDVKPYYKAEAAHAAAYSYRLIKFMHAAAALTCAALFAFIFFVEGHGYKPRRPRWPAALAAMAAYGVSLGIFYALLTPLREMSGGFFIFTVLELQLVTAFLTLSLGWVCAKWKRF